jgi:hypothetical protein
MANLRYSQQAIGQLQTKTKPETLQTLMSI